MRFGDRGLETLVPTDGPPHDSRAEILWAPGGMLVAIHRLGDAEVVMRRALCVRSCVFWVGVLVGCGSAHMSEIETTDDLNTGALPPGADGGMSRPPSSNCNALGDCNCEVGRARACSLPDGQTGAQTCEPSFEIGGAWGPCELDDESGELCPEQGGEDCTSSTPPVEEMPGGPARARYCGDLNRERFVNRWCWAEQAIAIVDASGAHSTPVDALVRYDPRFSLWVALVAQRGGVRVYLSENENEPGSDVAFLRATDIAGHGQDHCELVRDDFSHRSSDADCDGCSAEREPSSNGPVFTRGNAGECFDYVEQSGAGHQTSIVDCDVTTAQLLDVNSVHHCVE